MKRILSVTVHRAIDTDPDLSWIGEYSDHPGEDGKTIDRQEVGDWERGTYRYFIAAMSESDTGSEGSVKQDYARMQDYNRGDWCMMGVWVEAEVLLTGNATQKIRSGGLWGIESDSDESYFAEVTQEELASLRTELKAIGFTDKQITKAFTAVETVSH